MSRITALDVPLWVLFKFYIVAMHSHSEGMIVRGMWNDVRPFSVSNVLVARACDELISAGYLEEQLGFQGDKEISITPIGLRKIEAQFAGRYELIERYLADHAGVDGELNAEILDVLRSNQRPDVASESWQPLKIDRQAPEYRVALETTEKALDIIRSDNGYAATEPGERDEVVRSLEAGVQALKSESPSRGRLHAILISPLKFVLEKFAGAAIGEAAKQAFTALVHWLGTALS
jgi:hypothetical protein